MGCELTAHCTGVPTSQIVGDDNMYGSRGALVAVYAPHITESYVDPDYPGDGEAYVIPRGNGALVGVIGSGRAATRGRGQLTTCRCRCGHGGWHIGEV